MTEMNAIPDLRQATTRSPGMPGDAPGLALPSYLQNFVVRQPVLDGQYRVVGYELRLRDRVPVPVLPGAVSLQQAQDEMLLVSAADLEFQRALGNRLTFIALMPDSLHNPLVEQLPADKIVLSASGPESAGDLLPRCQALARRGLALALDDVVPSPELTPLLKLCRFVRLDVQRHEVARLIDRVSLLRRSCSARLVARNVNTEDAYTACRKLGFDLFQGYFFTRLQAGTRVHIDSSRQRILEALNLVMSHAEIAEIERSVKMDAGLSYKLLRLINSPSYGLRRPVQSIGQAVMMLGHDALYRWLTVLLFTHGAADPRSQALLRNALIRARFTESLGEARLPPEQRGGLFITGILSNLDALFNLPMDQAIAQLNLPEAVSDALIRKQGVYAPYLELVLACEHFDQDSIASLAEEAALTADQVNLAHVNAMIWAERIEV